MLKIKKVQTKKELLDFIKFPWKIYKDDPNWVPPLISERKEFFDPGKNPFFKHSNVEFFLAKRNSEIVGRVCGIVNHNHIEFHNEKAGFFGFFECMNDFEVAELLLDTVRDWLKSEGMEIMRGPANFSTNEEVAFLLEGFDSPPVFMMSYNPKYYLELMEKYGMKKAKDLYAWYLDKDIKILERVARIAGKIEKKEKLKVRTINLKDFKNEVKRIKKIYNSAWSRNWGFVPMTDEEFDHLRKKLKPIVDPQMVFIAEIFGEPVGFCLALPNVNPVLKKLNGRLFPVGILKLLWYTKIKNIVNGARIITLGVVDTHRKKGIETLFYLRAIKDGIKRGYNWGELSWVLEDNVLMNKALETLGAKLYKKYRIYEIMI